MARYYRTDLKKNALVSTEITGYSVSFLIYLAQATGDAEYLDAALRGARFLTRVAWNPALSVFPFEHSVNGHAPEPLAYFFDCGIIVRGLLSAWRASSQPEFLETAVQAGRGMRRHFQTSHAIHPILALPECRALPYQPRWSASPGCYQLKSAMAWLDLFEATGDSDMLEAYEEATANAFETADLFLSGHTDPDTIMDRLHAYAYFLEGLLPRAEEPVCASAIEAGIRKIVGYVSEIAPGFARSDVYAQTLRLRIYASAGEGAQNEAEAVAGYQLKSEDPRVDGAFCFGSRCGRLLPFANPVSTAFCVQALAMWEQYRRSGARPAVLDLV